MTIKYWMTLSILVNKFHQGLGQVFQPYLSQESFRRLSETKVNSDNIDPLTVAALEIFKKMHYSWLAPEIEKLPECIRASTVAALPEPLCTHLRKLLGFSPEAKTLAPPIKGFFVNQLYQMMRKRNVIPLEYLPDIPLRELMDLSKRELVDLLDYLALFDLAQELKQIVDKKQLQKIFQVFDTKHRQFLQNCMQKKTLFKHSKSLLQGWSGDPKYLLKLIQLRGLQYLGLALSGQNLSFMWHLVHRLDTGRGKLLLDFSSKVPHEKMTPVAIQRTLEAIKFIKGRTT